MQCHTGSLTCISSMGGNTMSQFTSVSEQSAESV